MNFISLSNFSEIFYVILGLILGFAIGISFGYGFGLYKAKRVLDRLKDKINNLDNREKKIEELSKLTHYLKFDEKRH